MKICNDPKQIEAANRIGKMFLGCANKEIALLFFASYMSSRLKRVETGSLNAEQLEEILNAALNYANKHPKI